VSGLHLDGVTKSFGDRVVVDDLHLQVADGELLCLLGPSGCGKTTTLRLVAGFGEPDAGRILIGGRDVTGLGPERRPTAMVFQNYALWPHMSVLENVTFGLRSRGVSRREAEARAREALEAVGLVEAAPRRPARLSGGEQQRVALARALVCQPEVLLLDEPLSNLDAQLRLKVREDLAELHERTGITMVFVTHDQDEALSLADRVAVMDAGRLEQVSDPRTLYRRPETEVVAGFVGRSSWVDGRLERGELVVALAGWPDGGRSPELAGVADGPVRLAFRPEDLALAAEGVEARVCRRMPRGHVDEVVLQPLLGGGGEWRAFLAASDPDRPALRWRPSRVLAYRGGRLLGEVHYGVPGSLGGAGWDPGPPAEPAEAVRASPA